MKDGLKGLRYFLVLTLIMQTSLKNLFNSMILFKTILLVIHKKFMVNYL